MAGRNQSKLDQAKEKMIEEITAPDHEEAAKKEAAANLLEIGIVDLQSLESIKTFCDAIKGTYQKIDYLVNNAGGGNYQYVQTVDGYESNFFVNYLGHFALTTQLLPLLKDNSRIVNFSSIGYKQFLKKDLDCNNLQCTNEKDYDQMEEYCRAKLCSILHSVKLQKEFEAMGSASKALACHPGNARTSLMEGDETKPITKYTFRYVLGPLMWLFGISHSLYDGALPAVEALVVEDPKPNMVYAPNAKNELTGDPIPHEIDHAHYKDEDIDALWDKTQELLKIQVSDYMK